ncbi:hypothetical protein KG213_003574 [Acinetobacter baumannii]|uniref:hypothetical protein n=1 Tax=Acinetobacter baumannii TaxID=470 RepID=UPI002FEC1BAC|nr:hypothetical protein [Acinetobacter baumannii]EKX3720075.1 hypothetical protein [Acinetobacter baumannii]EKX3750916.1 hypothetical protein [Acinetobacter baumannii]
MNYNKVLNPRSAIGYSKFQTCLTLFPQQQSFFEQFELLLDPLTTFLTSSTGHNDTH